jgi:O-succinylbenzoic acid--CoA ligase
MDHWLTRAAALHPERPALAGARAGLSYADLALRAGIAARELVARGVQPGDRVALGHEDRIEFAVALHACLLAGARAVPIDLRLSGEERAMRAAGAMLLVEHGLGGAVVRPRRAVRLPIGPAPVPLALDAVATVMHTSGTTAAPKPVELTYGNWLANAFGSAVALGLDVEERWLCAMPLAHVGGLSILIRSAIYATTVVLHERFETKAILRALMDSGQRITMMSLVPTMLARLLDAGLCSPPALRWALLGGGPIAPALLQRAVAAGVPVAPTYGMTEACSQIATFGFPLHGVDLRLDGDQREILVRGTVVAPGSLAADGWLHTGDIGAFDTAGRLVITGRIVDTIVSGGENVAPAEVEAVLLAHPAVADAGVFGRADPEWGEAVVARVVVRDRAALDADGLRDQLHALCAERLAAFKVPKAIEFAADLPRTQSGKLLRRELPNVTQV